MESINSDDKAQHRVPIRDGSSSKAVTIRAEPAELSPIPTPHESPRAHRVSLSGRRLSGRPPISSASSTHSLSRQISRLKLDHSMATTGDMPPQVKEHGTLFSEVAAWLQWEKSRRVNNEGQDSVARPQASDEALALDKLERILADYAPTITDNVPGPGVSNRTPFGALRRSSIAKKLKPKSMTNGSDAEQDSELLVPDVEATLDNSKVLICAEGSPDAKNGEASNAKENENWADFKREIVRLTHTLKLKRWKRVPIERGNDIWVERLSGALTNAVYVVSPPKMLPDSSFGNESGTSLTARRPPPKLLLRIYGPQAEHLIDRKAELSILRRLARKSIGPRLLGTFTNGRFEEFLYARTLTPEDLRFPETSKQIAKRMRELHDGIDLLEEERDSGPFVWVNWDKWVDRCERIVTWLDQETLFPRTDQSIVRARPWLTRGLVCGVEWPFFRNTVWKYRKYIIEAHGGKDGIKEQLVFAHNDTQYGNLLRLQPSGESPLLQPENEHKQLVVIDFEYASANLPGFEFANHFTEWCYNYHHPERAWSLNLGYYPNPQEQRRFVRAYVQHRPVYDTKSPLNGTPTQVTPSPGANSVSSFMLDSRSLPGSTFNYEAEERAREEAIEGQVEAILRDVRLWRGMCSAHWVAWGIVQAKVTGLEEQKPRQSRKDRLMGKVKARLRPLSDVLSEDVLVKQTEAMADRPESREMEESHKEGDEDEQEKNEGFDYLAYAQDRAMFFWGDCLQLGLVKEADLPRELLDKVKRLAY